MSVVLTKYTQAQDTGGNLTPNEYYERIRAGEQVQAPEDLDRPFPFKTWLARNIGVVPDEQQKQYTYYLRNWYAQSFTSANTTANIREDYEQLVGKLKAIFKDDRQFDNIADLNIDDEFEVELAIPYLSRKLKEIAVYYVNKRSAIKKSKLKYNMTGSTQAIERVFYEHLLKAYTKKDGVATIDQAAIWSSVPELSSVKDTFTVELTELYDDTEYFDRDPSITATTYVDEPSWTFFTSLYDATSTNPLVFALSDYIAELGGLTINSVPLSAFEEEHANSGLNIYNESSLAEKYLATTQFAAGGGYWQPIVDNFNIEIEGGSNFFYWPQGEYYKEAINADVYDPIPINDTEFAEGGTAGTDIRSADTIWVTNGQTTQGAWLKDMTEKGVRDTMVAEVRGGRSTIFKFPYPGFGVVSTNSTWAGKQVSNTNPQVINNDTNQAQDLYWSTADSITSVDTISIHNTTLIDLGAQSSVRLREADKLVVRHETGEDEVRDSNPNRVFNNNIDTYWPYRALETDIPIQKGEDNNIYWPYFYGVEASSPAFEIKGDASTPQHLAAVVTPWSMIGSTAGQSMDDSDVLYKVVCGAPTEAAWLSGCPTTGIDSGLHQYISGTIQAGLSIELKAGAHTRFVYDNPAGDSDITDIAQFVGFQHEPECEYLTVDQTSLVAATKGVQTDGCNDWERCTCKAVNYSPFGHPGQSRDDNYGYGDYIFEDTQWPNRPNIDTWSDSDDVDKNSSKRFAWFRYNGEGPEVDAGWGQGEWVTGDGTPFVLERGRQYVYYRQPTCCGGGPSLYLRHGYCDVFDVIENPEDCELCVDPFIPRKHRPVCDCTTVTTTYNCAPVWAKAILVDGEWVATQELSDMILNPGDDLKYTHQKSRTVAWQTLERHVELVASELTLFNTSSAAEPYETWIANCIETNEECQQAQSEIDTNTCEFVSTFPDYATWSMGDPNATIEQYLIDKADDQAYFDKETAECEAGLASLLTEVWVTYVIDNFPGQYDVDTLRLTQNLGDAQRVAQQKYYEENEITYTEVVTFVPTDVGTVTLTMETTNFIFAQPLWGWNVETNSFQEDSSGAKPFWAQSYQSYDDGSNINCYNATAPREEYDYLAILQPFASRAQLTDDLYVEYHRRSDRTLIWTQPLSFQVTIPERQWCHIDIDYRHIDPILTMLRKSDCDKCKEELEAGLVQGVCRCVDPKDLVELVLENECMSTRTSLSATDQISDLSLSTREYCGDYTTVTYCAQAAFSIVQPLTNTTNGGAFVDALTMSILEPTAPWANLANRHFPTVASIAETDKLSSVQQLGIFVPHRLGILEYVGNGYSTKIDEQVTKTGYKVYQDPDRWVSDRGLTLTEQDVPFSVASVDARWMKIPVTNGLAAGMIKQTDKYQQFVPYHTTYETHGDTGFGILPQTRPGDPWTGPYDSEWGDPAFEETFTRYNSNCCSPSSWDAQQVEISGRIADWSVDLFGNQYALIKHSDIVTVAAEFETTGTLWVRRLDDQVGNAQTMLSRVIDNYRALDITIYNQIISNEIRSVDVFYDTLFIELSSHLIFEKIEQEYDTGEIYSIADFAVFFDLSASEHLNNKLAGTWFDEIGKRVVFATISGNDDGFVPSIWEFSLDNSKMTKLFPTTTQDETDWIASLVAYEPQVVGRPTFTYNPDSQQFVLSVVATTPSTQQSMAIINAMFSTTTTGSLSNSSTVLTLPT